MKNIISDYNSINALYTEYLSRFSASGAADSFSECCIELNILQDMYKAAARENKIPEINYVKEQFNLLKLRFEKFGTVPNDLE